MKISVVCIGLNGICSIDKSLFYELGLDVALFVQVENDISSIRSAAKFAFDSSQGLCVIYSKESWPNLQKTMLMEFERSSVFVESPKPYVIANGFKKICKDVYFDIVYDKPFLLMSNETEKGELIDYVSHVFSSNILRVGIFDEQLKNRYVVYADEAGTMLSVDNLHLKDAIESVDRRKIWTMRGETPQEALFKTLKDRGLMVSTAESCTAGLISVLITDIPGASNYFKGGCVTYSNELKSKFVGVNPKTLQEVGAVSEEVATQMAIGVLNNTRSDFSVAVTGIAGPGGGSEKKPVGLVYIAVASHSDVGVRKVIFGGNRRLIRYKTAKFAILFLRDFILRQ